VREREPKPRRLTPCDVATLARLARLVEANGGDVYKALLAMARGASAVPTPPKDDLGSEMTRSSTT